MIMSLLSLVRYVKIFRMVSCFVLLFMFITIMFVTIYCSDYAHGVCKNDGRLSIVVFCMVKSFENFV